MGKQLVIARSSHKPCGRYGYSIHDCRSPMNPQFADLRGIA